MYDSGEYRPSRPFIRIEARDSEGTRAYVILAAGINYPDGCVLGKNSETGRAAPYDPAAQDGTEVACGVLCGEIDAMRSERLALMLVRLAEVEGDLLDWGNVDEDGIVAGKAALAAAGVIVLDASAEV